jgi:aminoglycoside phosphotransferase (APT) family kinase protein
MSDERQLRFFCKFGRPDDPIGPNHRFGLGYEARVYDELLRAWSNDVPPLHGVFLDESTQTLVLALDYVEGGTPLHQVSRPKGGMLAAARWIARFHRRCEAVDVPSFLHRYDADYYRTWVQRATDFTRRLHDLFPWLPALCELAVRRLPALLPATTIIHGEYQANNILVLQGRNVPTDWESAALAAGEIDLASLTWGWGDALAALCEEQYSLTRWPDGVPHDFSARLNAARVYLHLRWLGDSADDVDTNDTISDLISLAPLAAKFMGEDRYSG